MIESFGFGWLMINGQRHRSDLVIFPDGRILEPWRRKKGHRLGRDDIPELIASGPELIIAGTGVSGQVRPDKGLQNELAKEGIEFVSAPNEDATTLFNESYTKKRVGACFHLTC
ncbi:MTH938/NDUFAF3 family protein [Thermodesulfobacteriota bacterium]